MLKDHQELLQLQLKILYIYSIKSYFHEVMDSKSLQKHCKPLWLPETVVRRTTWYHLHNLKYAKNTHG